MLNHVAREDKVGYEEGVSCVKEKGAKAHKASEWRMRPLCDMHCVSLSLKEAKD